MSNEQNTPIVRASKTSIATINSLVLNLMESLEYKKQIGNKLVVKIINIIDIASTPR